MRGEAYPEIQYKVIDWGPGVFRLRDAGHEHRIDDMDVAVSLEQSSRWADVPDRESEEEAIESGTVAVLGLHVVEGPAPVPYQAPVQTSFVELTGGDCLNLATYLLQMLQEASGKTYWITDGPSFGPSFFDAEEIEQANSLEDR